MYGIPFAYKKLKRGPQVILPKDIGMIIAYTGIDKRSNCVDAGTGSGWLAIALARVCSSVVSYDNREEFLKIAENNARIAKLDNLTLKHGDVTQKIDEHEVDLVSLDMANADRAIANAYKALSKDGFICGYLPHTEQLRAFVNELSNYNFGPPYAVEVIAREMLVREAGVRPASKGLLHTAYLVFAQKLG